MQGVNLFHALSNIMLTLQKQSEHMVKPTTFFF